MKYRLMGGLFLLAGVLVPLVAAPDVGAAEKLSTDLSGYEEPPSISTTGNGEFRATINKAETEIAYVLSYADLEGSVLQAHIHLGQTGVNGGISVFLCTNLGNGPAGTQPCPPSPATVTGTIRATDVIGPTAQGISPGEFAELIAAIRAGVTYANVHSSKWPGGEIRGQLDGHRRGHD